MAANPGLQHGCDKPHQLSLNAQLGNMAMQQALTRQQYHNSKHPAC
jgi:hypothetical protein